MSPASVAWNRSEEESAPTDASGTTERFLLAIKVTIMFVSFAANLVGVTAIVYGKLYRKNMYLITLLITCVDLLATMSHMPVAILVTARGATADGTALCWANALLSQHVYGFALFGQILFNVDRYFAIQKPYIYIEKVTKCRLLVTWGSAAGLFIIYKVLRTCLLSTSVRYLPQYETCADLLETDIPYLNRLRYIPDFLINVTGNSAIVWTSLRVSQIARRHERRIARQDRVCATAINRKDRSTLAAFQTVYLTSLSFVLTGLPRVLLWFVPATSTSLMPLLLWIVYSNSIINVLIYGYKFSEFQMVCRRIFHTIWGDNITNVLNSDISTVA